jgi:hypothetical protein
VGSQWWYVHDLKRASGRKESRRLSLEDREARAKASWQHSPIYTASHDAQGRWRGVHFGDRARGAKTGPSKEGGGGVSDGFRKRKQRVLRWRLSGCSARARA